MKCRELSVQQVLNDIRTGAGDQELMTKYRLSRKGLGHLYEQLTNAGFLEQNGKTIVVCDTRKIRAEQIRDDIRAGVSERDLMSKYMCSSKHLRKIFEKLVTIGSLTAEEIDPNGNSKLHPPEVSKTPRLPRNYLPYPFTVYVVGDPEARGMILDITEYGFRVQGIQAREGEFKIFSFIPMDGSYARPFFLEAECRWIKKPHDSGLVAGFQIEKLSDHSRRELGKFIQELMPSVWY
ncbi:PilZ domain-containing protein [Desulfomonile tiedjei]|uniref:Uncharacterized protein n=1 Tax=Desulfomonile tiedjei (strain ATCC 49306 / DSM 6799 / DCB-1) TaxID=706587 RepID=I4C043_DESTA|nr:PilZ domain-containing protein [Desulfomonile tiedjei]AFM22934.1 hypothetical protein Desti_0188 [Desulfomonile tiedjei DSM 6799]